MKVSSFFSGAGGLDLGFEKSGFDIIWANEYDKNIWATYQNNFPNVVLDKRSITDVDSSEVPDTDGLIGGPPCQSWSEAGSARGIEDKRGQLFHEYVRIVADKKPLFFLAENVSGILFSKHSDALNKILSNFSELGYNVSYGLLNASDYGVPQDRHRVIIVGYQTHVGKFFTPPAPEDFKLTLREAIQDLEAAAVPAGAGGTHRTDLKISNHEYLEMGYSPMFMSRNRVRGWDQQSFTIQAGARHAPIHPSAPPMELVAKDQRIFAPGFEHLYRRLTVREAARIQTFPDEHEFIYTKIADGYKMIGNAVPVEFAKRLAAKIMRDLEGFSRSTEKLKSGEIKSYLEIQEMTKV